MSDAGWIPAYRKAYMPDHWLAPTARDPASRRDAWFDLVQMASHRPRATRHAAIGRGELVASVRTLAARWKWHRSRVERFMSELKARTAIETVSETLDGTVYRVVNYDTYAICGNSERDSNGDTERDSGETAARQEQEGKKLKSTTTPPSGRASNRVDYPPEFEAVWTIHGRGPKAKALAEWRKAVPGRVEQNELVACLTAYVAREINERFHGHDLFRWIRDGRWEEYRGVRAEQYDPHWRSAVALDGRTLLR